MRRPPRSPEPITAVSVLRRRRRRILMALWLLMICAILPARIYAQHDGQPLPGPMTSQELARYSEQLKLSAEQQRGLASLHEQYKADFKTLRNGAITRFVGQLKLIDGIPFRKPAKDDLGRVLQGHRSAMSLITSLDDRLFDQLQPLLTPEQAGQMPRVRADRERVRYIDDRMVADWLDPSMRLFDDLKLPAEEREAGLAVLNAHAIQVSALLREIWNGSRDMRKDWAKLLEDTTYTQVDITKPGFDQEMFEKGAQAWSEVTAKLKPRVNELAALNRKTYRSLMSILPAEQARVFRDEYFRTAYHFAMDGDGVIASFQAAMEAGELNVDQRSAVTAAYQDFRANYDVLLEATADLRDQRHTRERPNLSESTRDLEAKDLEIRTQMSSLEDRSRAILQELVGRELIGKLAKARRAKALREAEQARGGGGAEPHEKGDDIAALVAGEATVMELSSQEQENFVAPAVSRSDLASIEEQFALDDRQWTRLQGRYDVYSAEYERIRSERNVAIIRMRLGFMPRKQADGSHLYFYSSLEDVEKAHQLEREAIQMLRGLDESLFSDIQTSIINPNQSTKFWRVRLGREWTVYGRGGRQGVDELRCYGAYVNLVALIDRLGLSAEQSEVADGVLQEHSQALQAALRVNFDATLAAWNARDVAMAHNNGPVRSSLEIIQKMDAAFDELEAAAGRSRRQLHELIATSLQALGKALPERVTELHNAYERAAYPRVFADPTAASRPLAAALALEDLGQPQGDELQQLAAEYQAAYRTTSEQMIAANIQWDGETQYTAEGSSKRKEIKYQWDQLRYDRDELNAGVRQSLHRILTPAQLAAIGLR